MKLTPWVLVVLLGGLMVWGYGCEQKRQGALKAEIAALVKDKAYLIALADSLSKVYRVDTLRLTRWKVRYTADRDSVLSRPDTQTVARFVHTADSTIASCEQAKTTCEAEKAVKDRQIANQQAQIDKLLGQRPSWFTRTGGKLIWIGAGMLAGKLILK